MHFSFINAIRLSFAAVCALRPHLLLLDEPSNHLSLEAIEALAQACRAFQGGIVLVSHNKTLLSQVQFSFPTTYHRICYCVEYAPGSGVQRSARRRK